MSENPERHGAVHVASPDTLGGGPASGAEIVSAAAGRGTRVMEVVELRKEFRLPGKELLVAVDDVTFGLYRGAVVALVGESGSGKSTAARMLAGQERPSGGQILLDGAPVRLRSGTRAFRAFKRDVQMVFQDPFASLNPVHTVRYHLQRPLRLHRTHREGESERQALAELLEQVRLTPADQFLPKYPHELSGGQRQRVAIARALAVRPRVLLADEPVSMLDVSIRLELLSLLDGLRADLDLAMLYITHDIASARYFADETLVMYAGEVVERGPSEDLTVRPAHPYTQLLVSSAPDPSSAESELRSGSKAAGRSQRDVGASVDGCRFAPRCPLAVEHCVRARPPLIKVDRQRAAACWRLDVAAGQLVSSTRSIPDSSSEGAR